jgi:pimeloyl-ACP methyl ester carboxylesterase
MVAFTETDLLCYEFSLQLARDRGDQDKVAQLERQGPPPYYGEGVALKQAAYLMDTYNYMNADPRIASDGFNTFEDLAGSEYGFIDKINWFRGVIDTMDVVFPQLWDVDLRESARELGVPVYFLLGRHDVNAPPSLAEDYFASLDAPAKDLIWFEHSGHNPWVNESERFVAVLEDLLLGDRTE